MAPKLHLPFPYCLVSLHFGGAGVPNGATCTMGVLPTDTSTPAQIATTIKAQLRATGGPFGSGLAAQYVTQVILQDITVKQGPLDTGPEASAADGAALGTGTVPAAPSLALLVTKNTAMGGKRGRGRMYIPGLTSGIVGTGGQVTPPATLTSLQAGWNTFLTSMQAAGVGPALLHTYDVAKGQQPVSPSIITSFAVSGLFATQRNRMRR